MNSANIEDRKKKDAKETTLLTRAHLQLNPRVNDPQLRRALNIRLRGISLALVRIHVINSIVEGAPVRRAGDVDPCPRDGARADVRGARGVDEPRLAARPCLLPVRQALEQRPRRREVVPQRRADDHVVLRRDCGCGCEVVEPRWVLLVISR